MANTSRAPAPTGDGGQAMSESSVESIRADLQRRTGVDFGRYNDPELAEAIGNAVTFPLYLGRSLVRPVAALLLLGLIAFIITDSAILKTFLVFPGVLLVVVNGVLLGLVIFVRRIGADMKKIFTISTNLCVQALGDVGTARTQLKAEGNFPSLLEIFQGLNAVVILPVVIRTLENKIPFLGGLAGKLTRKVFSMADARIAKKMSKAAPDTPPAANAEPAQVAAWLDATEGAVKSVQGFIAKAVDAVTRVVAFPFTTIFVIVAFISGALVYGAWLVS